MRIPSRLRSSCFGIRNSCMIKRMPKTKTSKISRLFHSLGPGIITGASDDDPSGIATYAQSGAVSGFSLLWTALFTTPLMISVQEMCARIGLVTGKGLTGVLRKHYSPFFLFIVTFLVVGANTINIGADIAGMAAATQLLVPLPLWCIALFYAIFITCFIVFTSYHTFVRYMKWLTLALFLYILVPFTVTIDWFEILKQTFLPTLIFTKSSLLTIIAILGTTISPYLFFWQASMEAEDKRDRLKHVFGRWMVTKHEMFHMRQDVSLGMIFSNITMWFIILTTAITLYPRGITHIQTAQQAAEALRPIAGDFAYILFTVGIVGTGLLAIPVLAGSSSYILAEAFGWKNGLHQSFHEAKKFYSVMIISTLFGVGMTLLKVNPIQALFYTAVLYGVISPLLILFIINIANNKTVMGKHCNSWVSNLGGWITFIVMCTAVLLFFFLSLR